LVVEAVVAEHLEKQELLVVLVADLDEMQVLQVLAEQVQLDKVSQEDQLLVVVMLRVQEVAVLGQ
jgi:hypothetical protein